MARYKIVTFIDITRTNANRSETDELKISQQANFNSLLQAIGMRSNVSWVSDPKKHNGALPDDIDGKAVHWIWEFDVEREDVFKQDNDPVALLIEDLHGVPIIDRLENNIDITPAAFQTKGKNQNSWLTIIS